MAKKVKKIQQVAVLIVEGETEVEFYIRVLQEIRNHNPSVFEQLRIVKPINMKGISNFQRNAVTQFEHLHSKHIQNPKNAGIQFEYHIFLCIDTDVFHFQANPPLDKSKLKNDLLECGAASVNYIEAEQSIEDWFLSDLSGIQSFLKLKNISPGYLKKSKGADKLNQIFKQAGKSYIKGSKSDGFISALDVHGIMKRYCNQFQCLFDFLNIKSF